MDKERIQVACGKGVLALEILQKPGGKATARRTIRSRLSCQSRRSFQYELTMQRIQLEAAKIVSKVVHGGRNLTQVLSETLRRHIQLTPRRNAVHCKTCATARCVTTRAWPSYWTVCCERPIAGFIVALVCCWLRSISCSTPRQASMSSSIRPCTQPRVAIPPPADWSTQYCETFCASNQRCWKQPTGRKKAATPISNGGSMQLKAQYGEQAPLQFWKPGTGIRR